MSQRIRQLEDALKISHASHSEGPHPLLSDDLLTVKAGVDLLTAEDDVAEEVEVEVGENQTTGLR